MNLKVVVHQAEEGGCRAASADVPGLVAEGRTMTETTQIAQGC